MRFLKLLVIVMGVLIVVATTTLVVLVARRLGGTGTTVPSSTAVVLDEPAGTRMVGIAAGGRAGSRGAGRSADGCRCRARRAASAVSRLELACPVP